MLRSPTSLPADFTPAPIPDGTAYRGMPAAARALSWGFLAWVVIAGLTATAQRDRLRFRRISTEHGLSHVSVTCMLQDRQGFLWLGTEDGLNRYDGYDFQVFKHDPNNPNSLSDNFLRTIFEDSEGNLWMGTLNGGLNRFDPTNVRFDVFRHELDNPNSLSSDLVLSITEGEPGILWIGTANGLNRYVIKTQTFTHFPHQPEDPATLANFAVKSLLWDEERLWVGTFGDGLKRFDPATGLFTSYRHDPEMPNSLSHGQVTQIMRDKADRLWVSTNGGGMNRWNPSDESFTSYRYAAQEDQGKRHAHIRGMCLDYEGYLWLATDGAGLHRFDPSTGDFTAYRYDRQDPRSLSYDDVTVVFQDSSGVIWAGAWNHGLNKLDPSSRHFTQYIYHPNNPRSLSHDDVQHIYQDRQGIHWVGTSKGGLNRFDMKTETFTAYRKDPKQPGSISDDDVQTILETRDEALWVGTFEGGLNRFDRELQTFETFRQNGEPGSLSDDNVQALLEDQAGDLWVGTSNGLNRLDEQGRSFVSYQTRPEDPDSIGNSDIRCLRESVAGHLWVGTRDGLYFFDRAENRFHAIRHDTNRPGSLSHNFVTVIFEDRSGTLWIGTYGGLNKMIDDDPRNPVFKLYSSKQGFASDTIGGILEDSDGALWISTAQGLTKFDPREETFRNFDSGHGVQGAYRIRSYFKDRDGAMMFGGSEGLTVFHPEQIKKDPHAPRIAITDFRIFNKPVLPRHLDPTSPLHTYINHTQSLALSYKDSVFSFEFAALHFAYPEKNQYAYKLENFNSDWIVTDASKRFATFTNLDAGQYLLRVKGSNKDGAWNEEGASIRIRIHPPPWKTWWAYCLYALTLVAIVLAYIQSQRRKLAYERSVVQRLKQVDKFKDEFLANTSHELRTPLNGIIGIAESLIDGATGALPQKSVHNLSMIVSSGKRLSNLVNDILDFSKLASKRLDLRRNAVDLRALTDVVLTLSKPLIGSKDLRLVNAIDNDIPPADGDEDRLQQVMHNLVGNAIKFTQTGKVTVSARRRDPMLEICVEDTGVGIAEDKYERIFKSFEQADGSTARSYGGTGLGLAISKQLVELHGGTIWVESTEGKGSRFLFTLPLSREPLTEPPMSVSLVNQMKGIEPKLYDPDPDPGEAPNTFAVSSTNADFRILIVDDEPVNRQVLVNHLSLQNYAIREASSGPEALKEIASDRFDLVLLDIMMPRMSGYEVCQRLRADYPVQELPIIFLTAKNQVDDLVSGFSAGANDYLTKPISKNELLSRVKTHLQLLDINRNLEAMVAERTLSLKQRNDELETLDEIVKTINREIELKRVLHTLLTQGLKLFPRAEKGAFLLWDDRQHQFRFHALAGYESLDFGELTFSREELESRYIENTEQIETGVYLLRKLNQRKANDKMRRLPTPKSLLSMAVTLEGQIQGFLVLDNFSTDDAFDDSDLRKLDRFREHAVSAVIKARILQELQLKNEEIIKTRDQLVMQEKLASLGTLTAGIAHEIKNPLNFINNFSWLSIERFRELRIEVERYRENLEKRGFESIDEILTDLEQNAGIIQEHGERANQIVQSMMALVQGRVGKPRKTDINRMVEKDVKLAYHGRKAKDQPIKIGINLDLNPGVGSLDVVPQNLSRVIINLVNNAIDAVLEKQKTAPDDFQPLLRIRTHRSADHVAISIKDNGPGIDQAHRDNIFNPFFTTKSTGGSNIGLGLSISYDIVVQEHRGQLKVDSMPGSFTEFTILLPIEQA